MDQWYHSGIEGYCKAAAKLAGLPDDTSGWGNLGRDLFGDGRFDDPVKISKTWTLSRFRGQGRGNRPALFEKSWLSAQGVGNEAEAVATCVAGMLNPLNESVLYSMFRMNYLDFALGLRNDVLPAIADGFRTERYRAADIERFTQNIDDLLGALSPNDDAAFGRLALALVAALVYGPEHELARSREANVTSLASAEEALPGCGIEADADGGTVRITQLFSDDASYLGYSELFGSERAVLFGRGSDPGRYLEKCGDELRAELQGKELVVFPVAGSHRSTSNEHGAIVHAGSTWYYHDFSSNGTIIENSDTASSVHGTAVALGPGDRICMGFDEPAGNEELRYRLATTVLVSFAVNESSLG